MGRECIFNGVMVAVQRTMRGGSTALRGAREKGRDDSVTGEKEAVQRAMGEGNAA